MKFKRVINLKSGEFIQTNTKVIINWGVDEKFAGSNCYEECCCGCGKKLKNPLNWTKVLNTYYIVCGENKCKKEVRKLKMLEKMDNKE